MTEQRIILIGFLVVIVWLGIDQLNRHRRFMRLLEQISVAAEAMVATGDWSNREHIEMLMAEGDRLNRRDRVVTGVWSAVVIALALYVMLHN